MCVCSMHTFIQVLGRTDRSTIVLQCCKECRAEASMKKENREKEGNAGLMEAWSNAQYAGERERE